MDDDFFNSTQDLTVYSIRKSLNETFYFCLGIFI